MILGITALKVSVVGLAFNLLVPIVPVAGRGDRGTTPSTRLTTDVVGQLPPTGRRDGLALTRGTVVSQQTTTHDYCELEPEVGRGGGAATATTTATATASS
jgi:hypothetical protein